MRKTKRAILQIITGCILLGFSMNLWAGESDRIKGVADFLMGRASDNYLYILETRMKDNKAFKMYLPATYDQILNLDLKRVLQSSPAVWEKSIEMDLKGLQERFKKFLRQEVMAYVSKTETEYYDVFLERAGKASITIDGKEYRLTVVPLDAPQKVKESISKIYDSYMSLTAKLNEIFKVLDRIKVNNLEALKIDTMMTDALNAIYDWENVLTSRDYKIANVKQMLDISDEIKIFLIKTRDVGQHVENMVKPALPMTMKVNSALMVIEYLVEKHGASLFENSADYANHNKYFTQFKQYALFFAQLSDARSSDETKAILNAYTLPSVSFGVKRKPLENHFTVSAYLGVAAGLESTDKKTDKEDLHFYPGLTAPVGIEYSWGLKRKSSISLFASVFDFGPAVNAQLYEKEKNIKFKDVIAPGLFLVYGFKDIPLALGLGYQHSEGVRTESPEEHHALIFLSFDMPLFTLY